MAKETREFQKASVDRICDYFGLNRSEPLGNRYLLADEVGLGKTIIARDVAIKYAEKVENPLVYYVCGNIALINENENKLRSGADASYSQYQIKEIRDMHGRLALRPIVEEYEKHYRKMIKGAKAVAIYIYCQNWNWEDCFTKAEGTIRKNREEDLGKYYYSVMDEETIRITRLYPPYINKKIIQDMLIRLESVDNKKFLAVCPTDVDEAAKKFDEHVGVTKVSIQPLTPLTSLANRTTTIEERIAASVIFKTIADEKHIKYDNKKLEDAVYENTSNYQGYKYNLIQDLLKNSDSDLYHDIKESILECYKGCDGYRALLKGIKALMASSGLDNNTENGALVIVDEFQNYADFFNNPQDTEVGIVGKSLIHSKKNKILLLSATPFHYTHLKKEKGYGEVYNTGEENIDDQVENILRFVMGEDSFKEWCKLNRKKAEFLAKKNIECASCVSKDIQKLMFESGISRTERKSSYYDDMTIVVKDNKLLYDDLDYQLNGEKVFPKIEGSPKEGDIIICDDLDDFYVECNGNIYLPNDEYLEYLEEEYYEVNKLVKDENHSLILIEADNLDKYEEKINESKTPLGYIKDTPWLSSFAFGKGYKGIPRDANLFLNTNDIDQYKKIETKHARYAALEKDVFGEGIEKLLFIPPSRPYYKLSGVFEGKERVSKTLIFSRYDHTPRALTSLLSYESERKNVKKYKCSNKSDIGYDVNRVYGLDGSPYDHYGCCKEMDDGILNELIKKTISKTSGANDEYKHKMEGSIVRYLVQFHKKYLSSLDENIYYECSVWTKDCAKYLYRIFQTKEAGLILNSLYKDEDLTYIERIHRYCTEGCFYAVLDEYIALIAEADGDIDAKGFADSIKNSFKSIFENSNQYFEVIGQDESKKKIYHGFANGHFDDGNGSKTSTALNNKLKVFNSPFRPFVFVTTSVGAEGFDFHKYCRKIVHWSIEENSEKFQQKEGRIDRFHCHCVRTNLGIDYGCCMSDKLQHENDYKLWDEIYKKAREENHTEFEDTKGLFPDWAYPGRCGCKSYVKLERYGYFYPASRESMIYNRVKESVAIYRSLLGDTELYDEGMPYAINEICKERNIDPEILKINLSPFSSNDK